MKNNLLFCLPFLLFFFSVQSQKLDRTEKKIIKKVELLNAKSIDFQGEFITATDKVDNLDFQLKPGASNSWRYELSSFDSDVLDKGLNKITLSVSSECSVTLDRSQIEEMAEKNGMWFITIDAEVISCK